MHKLLQENIEDKKNGVRTALKKKFDLWCAVCGDVGSGKSTKAIQLAHYLDPTFNEARIVYNIKEFLTVMKDLKEGQAILFDEAYGDLNSMNKNPIVSHFITAATQIRYMKLYVIIVLPEYYTLNLQVCGRIKFLIQTYTKGLQRGHFAFYGAKKWRKLQELRQKKSKAFDLVIPDFRGDFPAHCPINLEKYEMKKAKEVQDSILKLIEYSKEERKIKPGLSYNEYQRQYQREYRKRRNMEAKLNEPKPEEPVKIPGLTLPAAGV